MVIPQKSSMMSESNVSSEVLHANMDKSRNERGLKLQMKYCKPSSRTSVLLTTMSTYGLHFALHSLGSSVWASSHGPRGIINLESPIQKLSCGSIRFVNDGVLLQLPASKSDPFRRGVSIPLSPSHDSLCPVTALRDLIHRYPKPPSAPLFCRLHGPFDRTWVLRKISQALLFAGINPT